jgi:Tol biopolymer transport system component
MVKRWSILEAMALWAQGNTVYAATFLMMTGGALFLLLLCAGVHAALAEAPQTAFRNLQSGQLIYIPFTQWYVSQNIYTANADGTGLTALTDTPEHECYPTWSPDGAEIAFARRKGGHFVISVMNADGTNIRDLMEPDLTRSVEHIECTPAWSPDGSKIAFTSSRDGNLEIYIMDADGSNPRNITNNPAADAFPAWSRDGSEIAFTSDRDGNMQVYRCGADGSNAQPVTDGETIHFAPFWSPDGERLLVTSKSPLKGMQLETVDMRDAVRAETSLELMNAMFGSWSKDGSRIAFSTSRQAPPRIDVFNLETEEHIPISLDNKTTRASKFNLRSGFVYGGPQWSPDGTKIVFASATRKGRPDITARDFKWPRRWLYLGAHGELFVPSRHTPPTGINELSIEPLDGGFALVHTGPKWSGTYAIVRPDCKIQILAPAPKEMDRSSAAQFWPYRDVEGHPAMPPHGAVIAAKHAVSPPGVTPPEGILRWFFQCADGDFYTPDPDIPIHANTFWVVKQGDGFQFIRTGPVKKGEVYATVTPNREVIFAPGIYEGPPLCWRHLTPQGEPVFSPTSGKWFPLPCDDSAPIITVHPDGLITSQPRQIP